MTRIAFFTSSMNNGGAQRTVANLAKGFSERSYSVDLLLIDPNGPYLASLPDTVNIIELESDRAITSTVELKRYLDENSPEVFFSTMEHLNVAALLAHRLSSSTARIVVRTANVSSTQNLQTFKQKIQYHLAKWLYPYADRIIALSEYVKRDMTDYYEISSEDIDVIYNPVSISEIQRLSQEEVNHPAFESNSEVIVSAGRFTEQKDMPTLIRAFERLNQERDVQLVLLGKGEEEEQLRQLIQDLEIEDKVYLPGFVDNPFSYMNATDIFVLSSKWEGFGNVLVEAMACGTPVVATNCPGGPSEILEDGKYGILVPVSDDEALASGINKMLTEPIDDRELHQRAGDFRYDRIVDQYENVFLEFEPN